MIINCLNTFNPKLMMRNKYSTTTTLLLPMIKKKIECRCDNITIGSDIFLDVAGRHQQHEQRRISRVIKVFV